MSDLRSLLLSREEIIRRNDEYERYWANRHVSSKRRKDTFGFGTHTCSTEEYDPARVYKTVGELELYYPVDVPYTLEATKHLPGLAIKSGFDWSKIARLSAWVLKNKGNRFDTDFIFSQILTWPGQDVATFNTHVQNTYNMTDYVDPFSGEAFDNDDPSQWSYFVLLRTYTFKDSLPNLDFYDNWDDDPLSQVQPVHTLSTVTTPPMLADRYFRFVDPSALRDSDLGSDGLWDDFVDQTFFASDKAKWDDYCHQWCLRRITTKPVLVDDVATASAGGAGYFSTFFNPTDIPELLASIPFWNTLNFSLYWDWYKNRRVDNGLYTICEL